MYNLLLDSDEHVIKIVERNVNIDYSVVFKNVFDKFIDKFSRDVMYKIIHEILPVNILMFKSAKDICAFLNGHLRFKLEDTCVLKKWKFALLA